MENQTTAREAQHEIPLFTVLKNSKTGEEYKICNFDHPDICPRTGIIEIEAMKRPEIDHTGQARSDYNATIRCAKDPNTDIIYGIPIGFHPVTGEVRWLPITLNSQTYFDRSISDQAKKAAVILRDFRMEGSPTLNQKPLFKVRDKDKQAQVKIERFMAAEEAMKTAKTFKVDTDELKDMAMNLGLQVHSYSPIMLYAEVLERANSNPKLFLEVWENPNREIVTAIKKAVEYGVVTLDPQGYWFNGLLLGLNETQAVGFLKPKPDVMQSISIHTASRKNDTAKANAKKNVIPVVKNVDENAVLKSELETLRKQLADLTKTQDDKKSEAKKHEKV